MLTAQPDKDLMIQFETKALRDTRQMLGSVGAEDAYQFVADNSHERLWRLLAEHSLHALDFAMADKAFVRCSDYQGVQFTKQLQRLDDPRKQTAEVAAYFKRFDEAEQCYLAMDRPDLAIELRMRLGDWFKVSLTLPHPALDPDPTPTRLAIRGAAVLIHYVPPRAPRPSESAKAQVRARVTVQNAHRHPPSLPGGERGQLTAGGAAGPRPRPP